MKFLICFVLGFLSLTPDISMASKESGRWKSQICFDPKSDKANGPKIRISDDDLLDIIINEELMDRMDLNEEILRIYVYKENSREFKRAGIHHMFVVLRTNSWWWSVEKTIEGITIQRSKFRQYVRDRSQCKRRPQYKFLLKDSGRYKMEDLFEWLYDEEELSKGFNYATENCQHFAERIFDRFANEKVLHI